MPPMPTSRGEPRRPRAVVVAGEDELARRSLDRRPATLAVADVDADDTGVDLLHVGHDRPAQGGDAVPRACSNFVTVSWLADLTPLDEHDVTLHAAPLSHGAGFHALAAVARAAHQVIPDSVSFDPTAILDVIRDHGVTNTWMVPTQIVMLTEAAERAGIDRQRPADAAVRASTAERRSRRRR